jgi:ELWxxDGT repeat protein
VHTSGSTVFFTADDGTHRIELWRTDGTAAKTRRVADYNGKVVNSFLFQGYDPVHGRELWTSDGTAAGTALVKDIDPRNEGSTVKVLGVAHSFLVFEADTSSGKSLWRSDGTPEGTTFLTQLRGSATATEVGGLVYFFQPDEAGTGVELWQTDSTPEGTVLVKHIEPTPSPLGVPLLMAASLTTGGTTIDTSPRIYSVGNLTVIGNTLYFTLNDRYGAGNELWKTDGTEAGTVLVKDVFEGSSGSNPHALAELNGELYFRADAPLRDSLWKTDGTPENTVLVKEFQGGRGGSAFASKTLKVGNKLYFTAYDPATGWELWQSDGTPEGTQVMDLTPSAAGSDVRIILAAGDNLFFTKGNALWCTDGTPEGTVLLNSNLSLPVYSDGSVQAIALGDRIIFSVANETAPYSSVWSSNGTAAGTVLLANVQAEFFTVHDGKVYFSGFTTERGDVWETDGTPAGTKSIARLDSGAAYLTSFGDSLLFTTDDRLHGNELWKLEIPAGPIVGGLVKTGSGTPLLPNSTTSTAGGTLRFNSVASSNKLSVATNGDLATATVLPTTFAPTSLRLSDVAPAAGTESATDSLLADESLGDPLEV